MDVFRNPLGRSEADRAVARRRKSWLETITLAVSVFCGVFFGAVFVAEHARAGSALWGLGWGLASAVAWTAYRSRYPAHVAEPHLVEVEKDRAPADPLDDPAADPAAGNPEGRDRWDLATIAFVAAVMPPLVLIGLLAVCWLPMLIIIGFVVQAGSASTLGILLAIGCTFAVMGAVEFGVTRPLARRWGLPCFN